MCTDLKRLQDQWVSEAQAWFEGYNEQVSRSKSLSR